MTPLALKERLEAGFPGAEVTVTDLTGTEDHYSIQVISKAFDGKVLVKRHRMINELLNEPLRSGEIHALQIDARTPQEL